MRRLAIALALLAACRAEERPAPRARAEEFSVSPPPAAAMQSGEDPPYAPGSVFRPETHRASGPEVPRDALLVRHVLTGEEAREFSYFGQAVALDGDLAVIGAPYADEGLHVDAGAAHVFRRRGAEWREEARLTAPAPRMFDRFGTSVAVSRDVVIVGADRSDPRDLSGAGAAYVFVRRSGTWRHDATLSPESLAEGAALGFSVAVDGGVAAAGAPGAETVFVFRRRDGRWIEEAALAVPHEFRASFGHAVAVDGDRIAVGAMTQSETQHMGGAVYVFHRDGEAWRPEAALRPPRSHELSRFGAALALRGDRLLVSAPRVTVGAHPRAGAAWLFTRRPAGWEAVQEIQSTPPRADEEFGRALSLTGGGAVIGSQFSDHAGLNTGSAQLFSFDGERLVRRGTLLAADLKAMNEFAFALDATDTEVVIGAPRRGENDNATGYAYVYRMKEEEP